LQKKTAKQLQKLPLSFGNKALGAIKLSEDNNAKTFDDRF